MQRRTLRHGVRRPWAMGVRAVRFRLPSLKRHRGAAQPGLPGEALARIDALEKRQRASDAKITAAYRVFGHVFAQAGVEVPDMEDTAEMPCPLYVVPRKRNSA